MKKVRLIVIVVMAITSPLPFCMKSEYDYLNENFLETTDINSDSKFRHGRRLRTLLYQGA